MKTKYYIVWIEGLSARYGEKISKVGQFGDLEYTTKMTDAIRIRPKDVVAFRAFLKRHGITGWTLETAFVPTSYAPAGTIYNV
mgnify:CR=1 FL=1